MSRKRETPLPAVRVGAQERQRLTLDSILPRLQRARQLPSGEWMASCPAHADENPSLTLRETPDGKLLVHCHAGCPQERVLEALRRLAGADAPQPAAPTNAPRFTGCTLQELAQAKLLNPDLLKQWYVGDGRRGGVDAVYIRYLNEQGEVVSTQWRINLSGDRFRRDGSPALYGLWRLREYSGQNLWAVEGVSDCWAAWHAGLPALAFPSNTPTEEMLQHFWRIATRFQNLYVLPDSDEAGQALVRRLAETCPPELQERVRVVPLPPNAKDSADLWAQLGGDADSFKAQLRECLQNATPITDVATASTAPTDATAPTGATDDDALKVVSFDALSETSAPAIVDGLIYSERITLLVGEAGIGKTTLVAEVVDALLHGGRLWGRMQLQPARVLWVGYDHNPAHLKHLMNTYYGERPRSNLYFVDSSWQEPLVPETFARWRALLEELRPDLLVCDALHDFFATPDELSNLVARDSIQLLRRLIEGLGTGVILLHHPSKMLATTVSTRAVGGAHAWSAKVDVVALMHYASREGFPPDRFVKLSVVKNRESGAWHQVFERTGRRFIPVAEGELPHSEWGIVKAYLEAHEQATYDDLLNALQQHGLKMTLSTLKRRVQRWSEKGLLLSRREGFPAKTVIQLAQVQLQLPVSSVASVASVAPVEAQYSDCVATDDDADFRAILESTTRPDDPFRLEPDEVDLLCTLWREAEQRNFPRLELPEYDLLILATRPSWLEALRLMGGTPAVPLALQRLTLSDAGATAPAPTPAPDGTPAGGSFAVQPQGHIVN